MAPDSESSETEPVWRFVTPEDAVPPASRVDAHVQIGISTLQSWVREMPTALSRWWTGAEEGADGAEAAEALSGENGPQPASDALLERIASAPDWSEAVEALDAALDPWMEEGPNAVPALVLGARYHGAPSIPRRWAEGALGRGLISCDPHAWTYLRHVWSGQISHRLTLHPFSADALARWFRTLAESGRPDGAAPISFRVAGEDDPVLPEHREATGEDGSAPPSDGAPTSAYLRGLAIYSQGHPGIAWTLWRRSLLVPPEADETSDSKSEPEQTIWVRPWSDVERPRRPNGFAQPDAFVLHALLLHGGLSADQLSPLVPTDQYAVRHCLHGLRTAGFIVQDDATWQLTPAGYPAACDILRHEAYLPDPYDT